jgi:hypothetical protein
MQYFTCSEPVKVFAEAINSENVKITPDDNLSVVVKFSNGSVGNLVYLANGDKGMPKERIEIFGAGRIGVINDFRDGIFYREGKVVKLKSTGKGHREEILRFLDSVKKGTECPISFRSVCLTTLTTFKILTHFEQDYLKLFHLMSEKIKEAFKVLHNYCIKEEFKGYDPYDGLNSTVFRSLPLLKRNKYARLVWIQLFKLLPLNLRKLVGIKKEYNSKALGLFLSGYCNLSEMRTENDRSDEISFFCRQLLSLISLNWSGACWGYNFDWHAKAFFQPKKYSDSSSYIVYFKCIS